MFADVFWYKEEANGVQQLDDSDRVEIGVENGQHFIDIYNTTQDDKGDKFSGRPSSVFRCYRYSFMVSIGLVI